MVEYIRNQAKKAKESARKIRWVNCVVFLLPILFISCFKSNEIYFDIASQAVRSSSLKGIRQLYIENDSIPEAFLISWEGSNNSVPDFVDFNSINEAYHINKGQKKIDNSKFKLMPFSKYTIERMQGDVGPYYLYIWTDGNGKVFKASREN